MSCILNIETATEVCSVAVSNQGKIIFEKEETKGPSHAVLLGQFVNEAIEYLRAEDIKPDAVAVSCGPGSYTGLRIGVSEAKGLCYGLSIPLIAISTLKLMAHGVAKRGLTDSKSLFCPMIDARRMEVYDGLFDAALNELRPVSADIIDGESFSEFLQNNKIVFFGNGAGKCKDVLQHQNAVFLDNIYPKAADMVELAEAAYNDKAFADVAYFEPFYLKEFVATVPKNKVLARE
ncbi:tRNA (adenosine(37)-N6)-threonylcarbamoyltransferase complex dimerization subunit type 1 TsaB [Dysgonomonas sp. 521]|uniref:tRNA (adenosine(37)-N6)-threonylcarbamoyltransferase complex dimerization subunit type 1 TsaB n=1 Tax=Dysgonomonas sp. 521 TaxID=2302932 RepID=UPI0013D118EA|nr:tRNA (adenosine(37)-N6)-threonylcarbamoyltransferase complex dimerization subunit type 1 TsaB [Dysgonomonas sp. 521]NDV97210.1 tRNA (adenosine(37)-N6)-threonylcarbamoyltransferase complex dimerization subunit type 1 TsaB [Dysgonomonas sp. 521]